MEFGKMFSSIDTHVAGEAYRIVTQSPIRLKPAGIREQARELKENFGDEKNLLLNEPRGHRGMHGLLAVGSAEADIGLLFFTHEKVSAFKYEGVLAGLGALLETGDLPRNESGRYSVETVEGVVDVQAAFKGDEVTKLVLQNKSASVSHSPDFATVWIDGKRNYLIYSLPDGIPDIGLEHLSAINDWGVAKAAELNRGGIEFSGVVLVGEEGGTGGEMKSVTFEKDGYILRSPGIDTTFSLLALQKNRGGAGTVVNQSIFGSVLRAEDSGKDGAGIVCAEPFVTGAHQFVFDREDPLAHGFLLA